MEQQRQVAQAQLFMQQAQRQAAPPALPRFGGGAGVEAAALGSGYLSAQLSSRQPAPQPAEWDPRFEPQHSMNDMVSGCPV